MARCRNKSVYRSQSEKVAVPAPGILFPRNRSEGELARLWSGSSTWPNPEAQSRGGEAAGSCTVFVSQPLSCLADSQARHPVGSPVLSVRAHSDHMGQRLCQATVLCREQEEGRKRETFDLLVTLFSFTNTSSYCVPSSSYSKYFTNNNSFHFYIYPIRWVYGFSYFIEEELRHKKG